VGQSKYRIAAISAFLFVLSGCVYKNEPMPQIVAERPALLIPPRTAKPPKLEKRARPEVPRDWLVPASIEKRWTAIVIHHSGTENGNSEIFDRSHREQNGWDGVGYDFVIGNGSDSRDGEVEVTFRWRRQQTGAHCKTPRNWANEDAVGICLVGNFNRTRPTPAQMRALTKLVSYLQERYRISDNRIYGHNTTPGARATDCPGRNFPLSSFKSVLGK